MKIDKKYIEDIIKASPDIITAVESVGAMYAIPSTNFLVSDNNKSFNIVNDTIAVPDSKNTIANTGSIVCSIGAVLDYISQRVDDKLNDFQASSIDKSKFDNAVAHGDPSKGKVIRRFETDNGEEIIVYDTGEVDRPSTTSALRKEAELRRNGLIPERIGINKPKQTYFSDADDIMNGVPSTTPAEVPETDVANSINESTLILDLISKYNNTTHLGYDIFSEMGFDIKQADSIITESAKGSKKAKAIKPEDVKHMKFDNKHIVKAIKYFNKAREEQSNVKNARDLDVRKIVDSENFRKGVNEIEQQFDCHIAYKFTKNTAGNSNAGTLQLDHTESYVSNVTISKSKGFQLHGMNIWLIVDESGLWDDAPVDPSMFGQTIASVMLHEIFHNIATSLRANNDSFLASTATTVTLLQSARSAKAKRKIIDKYIEAIGLSHDIRFNNPIAKRVFIKELMLISSARTKFDEKALIDASNNVTTDAEIDELIKTYKNTIEKGKKEKRRLSNDTAPGTCAIVSFILTCISAALHLSALVPVFCIALASSTIDAGIRHSHRKISEKLDDTYKNGEAFEESWCDMFAGMYNLPMVINFKTGHGRSFTANTIHDVDKLNELANLEKELFNLLYIEYPTHSERNHAAAKLAENALKQKNLDPATKKYLTWIKDNYSDMLKTDIETEDINTTYDPNRADDVDKHINDIINQGNVTVTESFV